MQKVNMNDTFSITWGGNTFVGQQPEKCPLCNVTIHTGLPITYRGFQVVFCCPKCDELFIGYYFPTEEVEQFVQETYSLKLEALRPHKIYLRDVSEIIKEISPNFVSIYSEAFDAKEMGLNQICGVGFRKAVEFLIKDYAKQNTNTDEGKKDIENLPAASVVNNYIADGRIQEIANRTLWIGNDETHYLRKWTEHDVDDLIALIRLTIHWIEMEVLSKKYVTEMPKGKSPTKGGG